MSHTSTTHRDIFLVRKCLEGAHDCEQVRDALDILSVYYARVSAWNKKKKLKTLDVDDIAVFSLKMYANATTAPSLEPGDP